MVLDEKFLGDEIVGRMGLSKVVPTIFFRSPKMALPGILIDQFTSFQISYHLNPKRKKLNWMSLLWNSVPTCITSRCFNVAS